MPKTDSNLVNLPSKQIHSNVFFANLYQVEEMCEVWTKSVTMRATFPLWECKCLQRIAI